MLATHHSMENSLRWTRRWLVFVLILAHLATVFMADAASGMIQHSTSIQFSSIQAEMNALGAHFTNP